MRYLALFFIRTYQRTLSPDHGILRFLYPNGYCQFHPTCSQYALLAFQRHGTIKGAVLSTKRLLRCHPWSKGGIDEVPTQLR